MILWLFASCVLAVQLFATITETANLQPLEKLIPQLDEHSLVLFDVDETLIIPEDVILRPCAKEQAEKLTKDILENTKFVRKGKYKDGYLLSKVFSKMKFIIIDPTVLSLIQQLQQKGVKTIAFTAMQTGPFGVIPNMENWRIQQLHALGIDFSSAFPNHPYTALKTTIKGPNPLFKQGVLATDNVPKGTVLKTFLDIIRWKPTKVVFIDNSLANLKTVETALGELKIDFIGFHYTAANTYPCQVDLKLAEIQFRHLAEFGEWLRDSEAMQFEPAAVAK